MFARALVTYIHFFFFFFLQRYTLMIVIKGMGVKVQLNYRALLILDTVSANLARFNVHRVKAASHAYG